MDGAVWAFRAHFYWGEAHAEAGGADSYDACCLGGFDLYVALVGYGDLCHGYLVSQSRGEVYAYWKGEGLGERWAYQDWGAVCLSSGGGVCNGDGVDGGNGARVGFRIVGKPCYAAWLQGVPDTLLLYF